VKIYNAWFVRKIPKKRSKAAEIIPACPAPFLSLPLHPEDSPVDTCIKAVGVGVDFRFLFAYGKSPLHIVCDVSVW